MNQEVVRCRHLFTTNCGCDDEMLPGSRRLVPPQKGYIDHGCRVYRRGDFVPEDVLEYEFWSDEEEMEWEHREPGKVAWGSGPEDKWSLFPAGD